MPETILGLDIGGSNLKAVLLSRGFRGGYRVLDARLIELAAAEGLPGALEQLFSEPAFRGSVCVTALSPRFLSFRNIRLPFRDERKIRQTIAFALEPQIQIPLEEVFIDYTLTGRTRQAEIFAALAPRTLVDQRTTLLDTYVRDTAVIDVDAVPLAARFLQPPDVPGTLCLLDIGARDTAAVFAGKGRVLHIRHFPFGGQTATEAVAGALDIGSAEAEAIKRSGEIPPGALAALRAACGRFLTELKNTQGHLLWQGVLAEAPGRIILTGGGSRTPGLAEGISELFSVACERTDLAATADIAIEEGIARSWDPVLMDQALALAARPMTKGGGFNFRQRASEARAGYGELRSRLKKGAAAALVVLILGGIEMGLGDYGDRLHLAALKRDITAEFKKSSPDVTRIVDPVVQLRGKIAEARKFTTGTGDNLSAVTVLDLLKEIAALAPAEMLLTSLNLDGDVIALKGEAQNFDALDTIKKGFANSRIFKTVTIGSTAMVKQGSAVEFDMKIILKK